MKWYEGNIAEAVTLSRQNNAVFVVYIQDTNNQSTDLNPLLEDTLISATLSSSSFVAIKVDAGSIPHQQFSEIYKDTPIPSIYFIGKTGSALAVIKDSIDQDSFMKEIANILQRNGTAMQTSVSTNSSPSVSTPSTSSSSSFIAVEQKEIVSDGDVKAINKEINDENKPVLSHDDKVTLAKELIEQKRVEKQKDEEEKEKLREIERRKMGQEVQNLQRWQHDQELKQLMDNRAKAKKEEKLARQRILDQIAQDKMDRATKFPLTTNEPTPITPPRATSNKNTARLQFRLSDGSTRTHDFETTATLSQVRSYLRETLQISSFNLSTAFPRREFTSEDDISSLLNLSLVPNAVLLVLPGNNDIGVLAGGGAGSGLAAMLWSLFAPMLNIFGWIRAVLFGGGNSGGDTSRGTSSSARAGEKRAAAPDMGETSARSVPKRRSGDTGVVTRRQGNIHRLTDENDSDDDNNTWNGNSTQQM